VKEMPKTYIISEEQAAELDAARKNITDKRIDKRLHAVQLRGEGMKNPAIAEKLDTAAKVVSRWVSAYHAGGIEALLGKKRGGNRRNMSFEEEEALLEPFKKEAEAGQIVEVSQLKGAYVEKVGHPIGGGQIYRVMERHEWRMVMPRSKHPKQASEEEQDLAKNKILCDGSVQRNKA
jgi:transposase